MATAGAKSVEIDVGESRIFHGYRGPELAEAVFQPPLTVALSRQTGARGRAVAERVADLLGFTFFTPESLELVAEDPLARSEFDELSCAAEQWVEDRLAHLALTSPVAAHPEMIALVRVTLEIAALGRSVLLGKGASAILPGTATLSVRLVAPEKDRVAYIAQWQRFSPADAMQYVQEREFARRDYMLEKFGVDPEALDQYAVILNTSELGVETCARLITVAAQAASSLIDEAEDEVSPA